MNERWILPVVKRKEHAQPCSLDLSLRVDLVSVGCCCCCCCCVSPVVSDSACPIDGSLPGSAVPGILQARTLECVPFPSPMHESEKWKWSRSVVSNFSWSHGLQPIRLLRPWDFPGKSTGVGCHCLLQFLLDHLTNDIRIKIFRIMNNH